MLHVEAAPAAVDVDHMPFKTVRTERTGRIWQRGYDEFIHLYNYHMEHPTANVDVLLAPIPGNIAAMKVLSHSHSCSTFPCILPNHWRSF